METTGNTSCPIMHQPMRHTTNRDQRAHKQRMARLRRRRHTLIRKVDEFHTLCGAELYMVIRMNGRFYEYSSTKQPSWPPQRAEIVGCSRPWPEGYTGLSYTRAGSTPFPKSTGRAVPTHMAKMARRVQKPDVNRLWRPCEEAMHTISLVQPEGFHRGEHAAHGRRRGGAEGAASLCRLAWLVFG